MELTVDGTDRPDVTHLSDRTYLSDGDHLRMSLVRVMVVTSDGSIDDALD